MTITYFDTSAPVKLYVKEIHSQQCQNVLEDSSALCTSRVAYAEVYASFSRIHRENRINKNEPD